MINFTTFFKYLKVISVNILLVGVFLIFTEVILWCFFSIPNVREGISSNSSYIPSSFYPNQKFTFKSTEGLIGIDSITTFSLNNFGYRGDSLKNPKPSNEFRIFLVGGSTTECLYIDDRKSVEAQLQESLNNKNTTFDIKVFNAGKSGDFSTDHLAMISHRINHLEPDLIVLFLGINDFKRTLSNHSYIQMPKKKLKKNILIDFLAAYSQLMRRFIVFKNNFSVNPQHVVITQETNYKDLVKKTKAMPVVDSIPYFSTKFFKNNLKSIIGICQTNEVQLVLVTQATTWNSTVSNRIRDFHWMTAVKDGIRYKEPALEKSINVFNDDIREIGQKEDVYILDLAKKIPKSEEYFYDDCHFNNNGVTYYSDLLAEFISNNLITKNN